MSGLLVLGIQDRVLSEQAFDPLSHLTSRNYVYSYHGVFRLMGKQLQG